ncbi:MAG TPA: thymidylate synthase [Acidimicrobiia bacterium]
MTTYETPGEAIIGTINDLYLHGTKSSPRGQQTRELLNHQFTVTYPASIRIDLYGRNLNHAISALEALQLVGQISIPEAVTDRVNAFNNYTDRGVFHGAYGNRISGRLDDLVKLLEHDRDSRQAVLTIYNSATDLNRDKRDIPCTIALQYMIRDNKLHARTVMRSNDVWLGLPYDLVQFITLQSAIAAHFQIPLGTYTHTVGSMHLYEHNFEQAVECSDISQLRYTNYLFDDRPINETSERCRRILLGHPVVAADDHETWLAKQLA